MVFVELLEVGDEVDVGEDCVVVEFVKVVLDIYVLIGGEIVVINEDFEDLFEIVNNDLYIDGWLFCIKVFDILEFDNLLDVEGYVNIIDED